VCVRESEKIRGGGEREKDLFGLDKKYLVFLGPKYPKS